MASAMDGWVRPRSEAPEGVFESAQTTVLPANCCSRTERQPSGIYSITSSAVASSFSDVEHSSGLEIDDEFEFRWLFNWNISWLLAI